MAVPGSTRLCAQAGASHLAQALAPPHRGAGLAKPRAQPGESDRLFGRSEAGHVSQFGQQDRGRGCPDARDALEQVCLLLESPMAMQVLADQALGLVDLLGQRAEHGLQRLPDHLGRALQTVALHLLYLAQRFQALDQRLEGGHFLGGGLPKPGLVRTAEAGDTRRVGFVDGCAISGSVLVRDNSHLEKARVAAGLTTLTQ